MDPVAGREVIESKEILLVFCKAFNCFGVLVFKRVYKVVIGISSVLLGRSHVHVMYHVFEI